MSETLERKPLTTPHEGQRFSPEKAETEVFSLGPTSVTRGEFQPGWRWSTDVKPVAGTDSCQATHTGVVLEGRMMVEMEDGSQMEYGPGDAFYVPPGHDKWVVGDEPCVLVDLTAGPQHARPH
jgi:mannose-6-phosphate isomerase-like protein (cupin superfamily)